MTRLRGLLPVLILSSALLGLAASAIWGDNGLVDWYRLRRHAEAERAEWGRLERENERMIYELNLLEEDPINLERMVADELGWARQGAVIHRFDDGPGPPPPSP